MNCPKCLFACLDSDSFCMKCGFNLLEYKIKLLENVNKTCPDCNATTKNDSKTCNNCGYPFKEKANINIAAHQVNRETHFNQIIKQPKQPDLPKNNKPISIVKEKKPNLKPWIWVSLSVILIIVCFLLVRAFTTNPSAVIKPNKNYAEIVDTSRISDSLARNFSVKLIDCINNNNIFEVNRTILPQYGLMCFDPGHPYPHLSFDKTMDQYLKLYLGNCKLFAKIDSTGFPNYLGDGIFEVKSGFLERFEGKLKLDEFNLETQSGVWKPNELEPHKDIEKLCNYKLQTASEDGKSVFSFYLAIKPNYIHLLGISYYQPDDINFIDSIKVYYPFETEEEIRSLIGEFKYVDETNGYYLDFSTNEFTGFEYPQSAFNFDHYTISDIQKLSNKINICTIDLLPSDKSLNKLSLRFTNKGNFYKSQIGAFPEEIYKIDSANTRKINDWNTFIENFKFAVSNKDGCSLLKMTNSADFFDGGGGLSQNELIHQLNIQQNGELTWESINISLNSNYKETSNAGSGIKLHQTESNYPIMVFEFKDGGWSWIGIQGD